jgi:uncharacterized protein (DUF2147 family)
MKRTAVLLGLSLLVLLPGRASGQQNADAILGKWLNGKGTAQIEIVKAGGKYSGTIVWLKEPVYPATDKKGMAGKEKVDRENPDPARRSRPVIGLTILRDFVFTTEGRWERGMIYDPENGKDYRCKITLRSPDVLDVRGFIGISLIGRTPGRG